MGLEDLKNLGVPGQKGSKGNTSEHLRKDHSPFSRQLKQDCRQCVCVSVCVNIEIDSVLSNSLQHFHRDQQDVLRDNGRCSSPLTCEVLSSSDLSHPMI